MSGRAGRRGKDDRGIVIQMLDEKMDPQVAKGKWYGDCTCGTSVNGQGSRALRPPNQLMFIIYPVISC